MAGVPYVGAPEIKARWTVLAVRYHSEIGNPGLYTVTGVVCDREYPAEIRGHFEGWQFRNLDWNPPTRIDLPDLSTKEKLALQRLLPCEDDSGATLQEALGYSIADTEAKSRRMLGQWALHHRYAAHFVKAHP